MPWVLDTTVLSALMRGDPAVSERLLGADPNEVKVPQPVVAEVRYGLARLPRSRRRTALEGRLEVLLRSLPRAVWTDAVSMHFGETKALLERKRLNVDDFDVAIAAHALALEAVVVTDNVRHFRRVPGLAVESWSSGAKLDA
jgi:tRNA(fMet)-specific endonuclease VapC